MTMNRQEKLLQELRRWDETCPGCALCKPLPKRNNSKMGAFMKSYWQEKFVKSAWHALIAAMGCYELRNHKTTASKVLACGLISFHADAAICDWLDKPTTMQRILHSMLKGTK